MRKLDAARGYLDTGPATGRKGNGPHAAIPSNLWTVQATRGTRCPTGTGRRM
jgi:hypothetical protein